MKLKEFDQFCKSLPETTFVIQWGDAHVWKIGGKVFAVGGWSSKEQKSIGVTFKCSPETFCELKNSPGMRPAPYLASRGFIWLQWLGPETVSVSNLKGLIVDSYTLVAAGLSQKKRRQLGIEDIV